MTKVTINCDFEEAHTYLKAHEYESVIYEIYNQVRTYLKHADEDTPPEALHLLEFIKSETGKFL